MCKGAQILITKQSVLYMRIRNDKKLDQTAGGTKNIFSKKRCRLCQRGRCVCLCNFVFVGLSACFTAPVSEKWPKWDFFCHRKSLPAFHPHLASVQTSYCSRRGRKLDCTKVRGVGLPCWGDLNMFPWKTHIFHPFSNCLAAQLNLHFSPPLPPAPKITQPQLTC